MKSDKSGECGQAGADNLCVEMNDLMHDYEVMSRISDLVAQLKGKYEVRNCLKKSSPLECAPVEFLASSVNAERVRFDCRE